MPEKMIESCEQVFRMATKNVVIWSWDIPSPSPLTRMKIHPSKVSSFVSSTIGCTEICQKIKNLV